ncbi:MAG TPA: hypothetical protein VEI97_08685 [bacterium]|nr:hypothetical protein [bacterium]
MSLTRDQWWALGMMGADASLVLLWELFYAAAFAHSLAFYWGWYGIELVLAAAFVFFSFRWMTSTDLHRRQVGLMVWAVLLGIIGWRVITATERVVAMLGPLAAARH